jgi:FkbM family methyltransferase
MGDYLSKFEEEYFNSIKQNCKTIFDVGAGSFSIFYDVEGIDVHYFEPHLESFEKLKTIGVKNKNYYFNNFGLSDKGEKVSIYADGSLYNRNMSNVVIATCDVKSGLEYCNEKNITHIDFLKIDVEGMETKVLLGFGDILKNIRYIQFEYGIGLRDAGSNLKEIMDLLGSYGFNEFYKNGQEKLHSSDDFWEWCNINTENSNLIKND